MELLKSALDRAEFDNESDANPPSFLRELPLLRQLAIAYNHRSTIDLAGFLADDVEYYSQASWDPVVGRERVLQHLESRFEISRNGPNDIYAEIGYCGSEWGRIRFLGWDGRPCILVAFCYGCKPIALITVDVSEGKITAINVCLAVPDPNKAKRTGEYPE